ncbi:MAG: NAD-dependent epimerase/dehydratase family protein [Oscillospiraceae bacterium]|nr:NAD-dependent epimerase/dehydratase family protein [Oscillospiraceae bacterium]
MGYKNLKFPEGSNFLVTGGAGFIGSNLCEAIINMGFKVRCLDNFSTGKRENIDSFGNNSTFELIEGDIRDYETCLKSTEDIDFVLHQAAWGSVPRSVEMPLLYDDINIKGSLNMLEASLKNGVKRFVYASSAAVYGDSLILPQTEGSEGHVLSPYALTKKVNEEYARLYKFLYGLDTYGLRYFNVFGKRQDPEGEYASVIPKFIKTLLNGEVPVIYGDGKQTRDFVYIENVIEANLKACLAPGDFAGEAYNIAYGVRDELIDIYYDIARALGKKDVEPEFRPGRKGDIVHSGADIKKAREALGYDPEWDFKRGIEEAAGWYGGGSSYA